MKKRLIFSLVFLLFIEISFVSSAIMHQAPDFKISVAGSSMTLQQAADGGYLRGASFPYASSSSISMGQHDASQIWVNVNGAEKTLLSALSTVNGLCGSGSYSTYSSASRPNPSHLATEIQLASGQTLQASINAGTFCTACTPGETRTKDCDYLDNTCRNYNDVTETCNSVGDWAGVCNSYTNTARGTSCSSDGWHSCDGGGSCVGWSGTGCSGCPFGTDYQGTCPGSNSRCIVPAGYQSRYNWDGSWTSWIIPNDLYMPLSHYPYCYGCNFCFAGLWCWSSESKSWQIKPV